MARRTVTAGSTAYTIAETDPPRLELLPWAILRTRVVDELSLAPPIAPISLTSTLPGATARIADGGVCGLVARPFDVSAPLTRPNSFTARVTAAGYLARDLGPAIETARRALNTAAVPGVNVLDVVPGDPVPSRRQFAPGRGVLLERAAPTDPEQFTTVRVPAAPPSATDVPTLDPVGVLRPPGTRVAGVPLLLPDQPLHRDATLRIHGTVRLRTGPSSIVGATGARVAIAGVWWDYPSSVTAAPIAPDVCGVDPTLRLSHPIGATVHRCTPTVTGPVRRLRDAGAAESSEVVVAPNTGLNPAGGDLLRIGDALIGDDELVVTDGFDAVADPAAPVRIRLRAPFGKLHRANEPVRSMSPGAVALVGTVAREALTGDAVLFCPALPPPLATTTLVVENGSPRATYYRATQFPTTPGGGTFNHVVPLPATGRFSWPPIARIAQVRVVVDLPAHVPVQVDMALDDGGDASLAIVLT
jgi:hypothetical protein